MAESRYAFYVRDPTLTSEQLKAALQSRYPGRVSIRRVFVNVVAPAKDGFVVRVDKSVFTRVEVTLHNDYIVTVIPVTGKLGCLIGWARLFFLSPKIAAEVRSYLTLTSLKPTTLFVHAVENNMLSSIQAVPSAACRFSQRLRLWRPQCS